MFCQQCPVCGIEIDLVTKDWRAEYQALIPTDDSNTPVQSLPPPTGATPEPEISKAPVHYACWKIACLHSGVLSLVPPRFLLFKQCMMDLAPLQMRLRSVDRPDESNLHKLEEDQPLSRLQAWGNLDRLPFELRCQILENLTNAQDVQNFAQATEAGFPRFVCRNLCWRLFGVKLNIAQLRHIAQALCDSPGLVNHTIIWENVKRILTHMDRPFRGVDSAPVLLTVNLTWPVSNIIHTANILQLTGQVSCVDFHFCHFGSVSYLTGIGVDSRLVGYRGDQVYTEELPPTLSGLRLIFNRVGINAMQIRSGGSWSAMVGGHGTDAMRQGERTFFSESWDLDGSDLIAHFDSVKLVGIGATTAGRKGAPSTWISRNGFCKLHPHPSPVIAPTIPHTWDVLYLRSDVTTFSVFVYDEEQDILGFEVGYSDGTSSSLGLCDDTLGKLVKLTLCLSLEEACLSTLDDDNIRSIRIGESRTSDSLAIELWTTSRVFAIGTIEENQAVHFNLPTAMAYAFSHHARMMPWVVGFALPSKASTGSAMCSSENRPAQIISYNPVVDGDKFFCSRGKLSGIVGIVAYSETDPATGICGVALAYRDEPPIILGQARKKCGSSEKQHTDDLREIFVYYAQDLFGRIVVGLRLLSWSSYNATFGDCSGSDLEILTVSNETDTLVWRFNQVSSKLTLQ